MPTKAGQEILDTNHGQGAAMDMVQWLAMISCQVTVMELLWIVIVTLPKSKSLHFFLDIARACNVCKAMQNKECSLKRRNLSFPKCQKRVHFKCTSQVWTETKDTTVKNWVLNFSIFELLKNDLVYMKGEQVMVPSGGKPPLPHTVNALLTKCFFIQQKKHSLHSTL